ncbi:cytochrome C oxidase subunit II [Methylomonas sp. MO1]|uniref:cytochrome c oxidase subunit II n=1 Tax=unclassified Methylomonas TaxID=2608980 RepID=UPI00036B283E|nr:MULTISPECIES: cytochrome c oxidase subunit II [unclassified Methylomonas]MDT4290660.1 cytochrome C oxidase subunit II [Methylomonas sp. MO1]
MHIHQLEKQWAAIALMIAGLFVVVILSSALFHGIHAPSNVEAIDSAKLHLSAEFAEDKLGVQEHPDGSITVRMVAGRYGFYPKDLVLPAETNITFRWVSLDVIHGVHIPMTNMSTMIVPGYVAQVKTLLHHTGDYPLLCNEYCGMGHAHMWSNIKVVGKAQWEALNKQGGVNHG